MSINAKGKKFYNIDHSKYVSKVRQNLSVLAGPEGNINKFDPSKYVGVTISCPKPCCDFETVNMAAMNNHLRRHTQTFKCGHCGKAFPNSAEFHEHSALMHGNKIPDQVSVMFNFTFCLMCYLDR